jgi:hypothetical protein
VSHPNSTEDKDELEVEDAFFDEDGIGKVSFTKNSLQSFTWVCNLELNEHAQATLEIKVYASSIGLGRICF